MGDGKAMYAYQTVKSSLKNNTVVMMLARGPNALRLQSAYVRKDGSSRINLARTFAVCLTILI